MGEPIKFGVGGTLTLKEGNGEEGRLKSQLRFERRNTHFPFFFSAVSFSKKRSLFFGSIHLLLGGKLRRMAQYMAEKNSLAKRYLCRKRNIFSRAMTAGDAKKLFKLWPVPMTFCFDKLVPYVCAALIHAYMFYFRLK